MPTPIRTIEAFLSQEKAPELMTDMQTLKWWIEHANQLENKLKELNAQSELRERRIYNMLLERNEALYKAEQWKAKYLTVQYERMDSEPPIDYVPTEMPPVIFRDQE